MNIPTCMTTPAFDIYFTTSKNRNRYRAKVTITDHTENIMRFTISAGGKEIKMEKWLFRKTNQWKLIRTNFVMDKNTKANALLVLDIQNAIDAELKKRHMK